MAGIIGVKRLQQAVFEMASSQNRAAGSGGGAGFRPLLQLGISSVFVNTGGLTSTSYTTMPAGGVAITFQIPRVTDVKFEFFATAWTTAGGGQIRIRCNVPALSQASGPFKFQLTAASNAFGTLIVTAVPPGIYTAQMEYQVDGGTTGFIDQSYVTGFQLGA